MDMQADHAWKNYNCRDPFALNKLILFLDHTFTTYQNDLNKIRYLAQQIKEGIEKIDPFIQQSTQTVCPSCKDVCCVSEHGYYNVEDLVYHYALDLKPQHCEFGKKTSDPCQFLMKKGCCLKRSLRPSGCNWYFCDSLLDDIETRSDYRKFDDSLQEVADLWIKMMDEFTRISSLQHS